MILQALLSIAFITIIAGALLTSALVNAKVAAHETATRIADAALARGTNEFVNWAQLYVAKHGAATTWPSTRVVDQPVEGCRQVSPNFSLPCSLATTISYSVVGSGSTSIGGPDPVTNLQMALRENRISGEISATITDSGGAIAANESRSVTVRVFDAAPFAILTGNRDVTASVGDTTAEEGDTGGYIDPSHYQYRATPNPLEPASLRDTSITVTMACSNSAKNGDESDAFADNSSPGNDSLPWGLNGGRGFEAPCAPTYAFTSTPPIPSDAILQQNNEYNVGAFEGSGWLAAPVSKTGWPK